MATDPKKVYFPVESLVGLGHFNRTGKLVREMVKNGLDVTVASGTFVDPQRFFAGANLKDLPPYVFKGGPGVFYSLGADGKRTYIEGYNEQARKAERTALHLENIARVKPDVFISEFWPFDRPNLDHEMEAMIKATQALRIVSVRDVLHAPENAISDDERKFEKPLREGWTIDMINNHYDAVLVHGDPNFIPLSETFSSIAQIKKDIIYTGYVIDDLPKRAPPADGSIAPFLVSCGSGKGGGDMIFSVMTAWQKLLSQRDHDALAAHITARPLHIICGPRFAGDDFDTALEWAQFLKTKYGQETKIERYRQDYTTLLANAAFSVSLAGYNTTLETLAIGTPSLFIPNYEIIDGKAKMMSEQLYRLIRLEQMGLASYIRPGEAQNSETLSNRLKQEFALQTTQGRPKASLNVNGAENTLDIIQQLAKKNARRI